MGLERMMHFEEYILDKYKKGKDKCAIPIDGFTHVKKIKGKR